MYAQGNPPVARASPSHSKGHSLYSKGHLQANDKQPLLTKIYPSQATHPPQQAHNNRPMHDTNHHINPHWRSRLQAAGLGHHI